MVLQLTEQPLVVEDANLQSRHPAEAIAALRSLLVKGAEAVPDPHRKNFFEIQNCKNVYYVHCSPVSGKVLLLGIWPKVAGPTEPEAYANSGSSIAD